MRDFKAFTTMGRPNVDVVEIIEYMEKVRKASQLAHWNIRGGNFGELHKLFGEIYDFANAQVDLYAERSLALNFNKPVMVPDVYHIVPVINNSTLLESVINVCDTEFLKSMMGQLDDVTANMLQETIGALDKFAWMLKSSR